MISNGSWRCKQRENALYCAIMLEIWTYDGRAGYGFKKLR